MGARNKEKEFAQGAAWLRIHGYLLHKYNQGYLGTHVSLNLAHKQNQKEFERSRVQQSPRS